MIAWMLVVLALPPGAKTITFKEPPGKEARESKESKDSKDAPALVQAGALSAAAEGILRDEAKAMNASVLSLVVCLERDDAPVGDAIKALGDRAAAILHESAPSAEVSWSARQLDPAACPKGLLLLTWERPAVKPKALVRALAGGVKTGTKSAVALTAPGYVEAGSDVVTEADGWAWVDPGGGLTVRLGPGSRLEILELGPAPKLKLASGSLELHSGNDGTWTIETDTARVDAANGTARLDASAGSTRLAVYAGKLSAAVGDAQALLGPGDGAVIASGATSIEVKALPAAPLRLHPGRADGPQPLELKWTAADEPSVYRVEIAQDPTFSVITTSLRSESASATLEGLGPGDYFWRVVTVRADGLESKPSAAYRARLR